MLFEHLADKLSPFLLDEKYYPYDIPTKKQDYKGDMVNLLPADTNKYLMYDFYVLDYLKFLVDNMPPKQFRDLPPDLEDSVQDAVKKLFPHLREELLNAVFYAMCAEFRNSTQVSSVGNLHRLSRGSKERKLYADWLKYMKVHRGSYTNDDLETLGVEKPSSDVRTPELEKNNSMDRNLSYKAANYSMKENGASRKDFVQMMDEVFEHGSWNSSYGGSAWAGISEGWLTLNDSEQLTPRTKQAVDSMVKPMGVAIDHVYDLQHNTDTVFNKLKSYYSPREEYRWIKTALDDKANVQSYHDLIGKTSGAVKSMALPVLYNRLGTAWEDHVRKNRPEDLYDRPAEEQKVKDAEEAKKQKAELRKKTFSDKDIPTPKDEYSSWKKGDFIKCIDNEGHGNGKLNVGEIYIIQDIKQIPMSTTYFINVKDTDHNYIGYFSTNRFENVTKKIKRNATSKLKDEDALLGISPKQENHNFKVGDIVKRKNTRLVGKVVRLFRTASKDKGLKVELPNGMTVYWKPRNTEHVIHPTPHNSKVGDMVLCIDDEHETFFINTGREYKILKFPDNGFINVEDNNGKLSMDYVNNRFAVIPQKEKEKGPESKYKVGDRVIYTTDEPKTYNGVVNEIKSVPNNPTVLLKVYFKELGQYIDIQETDPQLKKAPRTFSQKVEDDTPKVGDDVVVIKDGKLLHGTLSDLTSSGTKGWVDIPHVSGFHLSSWFPMDKIKKDTSGNHIDTDQLKIGDDVTVTSKISKKVFFGKLKSIDYQQTEGLVDFPPQNGTGQHAEWFPLSQIEKDLKI